MALETYLYTLADVIKSHAIKASRESYEVRIEAAVAAMLDPELARAADAIEAGELINFSSLNDDLRAFFEVELTGIASDFAAQEMARIKLDFDLLLVNEAAAEWARQYTFDLVRGIDSTTQSVVQRALDAWLTRPGFTREQLEAMLAPSFGQARAEMIAVTEVTRAVSRGQMIYQTLARQDGVDMERVWFTLRDEQVCPICGPLHRQPESVWIADYPEGPPAHVRCRCDTSLRLRRQ